MIRALILLIASVSQCPYGLSTARLKATNGGPITTTAGPITTTVGHETTTALPISTTPGVIASTAGPITSTDRPITPTITTTAEPNTTTDESITTSDEPLATTTGPIRTTAGPITITAGPITTTSGPIIITSGPITATAGLITTTARTIMPTARAIKTGGPITATAVLITTTAGPITTTTGSTTTTSRPITTIVGPLTTTAGPITARPITTTSTSTTNAAGPITATAASIEPTAEPITTTVGVPANSTTLTPPTTTAASIDQCKNGIPAAEIKGFLDAHNKLRRSISAGTYVAKGKKMPAAKIPIADLTWACDIEKSAQASSDRCVFEHSENRSNLGENLYAYMTRKVSVDGQGKAASDAWESEFQDIGWPSVKLTRAEFDTGIGHATQMAWAKSTKFGCGMTKCKNGRQLMVVCQYRDAGNVIGWNIYEPV